MSEIANKFANLTDDEKDYLKTVVFGGCEQAKQAEVWEPSSGVFFITTSGDLLKGKSTERVRLYGAEFDTFIASSRASEHYRKMNWMYKAWIEIYPKGWEPTESCFVYTAHYDITKKDFLIRMYSGFVDANLPFKTKADANKWVEMVGHLLIPGAKIDVKG